MEPKEIEGEKEINPEEEENKNLPLTGGQVIGSAATEIGFGVTGEVIAGLLKKKIPFAGVGARFLSGAVGSTAAQSTFEDKEAADLSIGRILAAGAANTINIRGKADLNPVRNIALKSAAIAGGERAAADFIDTGEVDLKSTALAAGAGAALGGAIGAFDAKYFSTATRLIGKSEDEINELVATNQLTDEFVADALAPVLGKEATKKQIAKTKLRLNKEAMANDLSQRDTPFRDAFRNAMNYIAPARQIGKGAREGYYKYINDMERAEALSTKIEAKVTRSNLYSEDLQDDISDFMDGGVMTEKLSKESIAGDLNAIREIEMTAMKELYDIFDKGDTFAFLPTKQRETLMARMQSDIDKGVRTYDTATYKAFVDKKWTPDSKINKIRKPLAKEEVRSTLERRAKDAGEDISDPKIVDKIDKDVEKHFKHLLSMKKDGKGLGKMSLVATLPGRFEAVIDGHMPGPAERLFLGEQTSNVQMAGFQAKYRIRDTRRHIAQMNSVTELVKALKKSGQLSTEQKSGYVRLKTIMGELKDLDGRELFIPAETSHAIGKLYESQFAEMAADGTAGVVNQLFGGMVAYSKAAKVIYNPPSYMVNAIGGAIAAMSNGVFPFGKNYTNYVRGLRLASAELEGTAIGDVSGAVTKGIRKKQFTPEYRKQLISDIDEMYDYGVGNASINASEVAAAIRDGKIGNLLEKGTKAMGKLYSVTDTATRYAIWKSNQDMVRNRFLKHGAILGESKEAIERRIKTIAASITNDTYQNYERTSKLGKYLSRRGILPPFVTFTLELARNTTNQFRFAGEMINGKSFLKRFDIDLPADPAQAEKLLKSVRQEGRRRAGFLFGALAVSATAKEFLSAGADSAPFIPGEGILDPQERDDFAFFGFSYMRDKDFMATIDKETKKGTFALTSYIFPHATLTQFGGAVFDAAVQGKENEYDTTKTLTGLMSEELMGEGTFVNQNVMRAIDNRDVYGEKISTSEGFQALKERVSYAVGKTFEPGIMREIDRLESAAEGTGDFTMSEVLMRQLGLRFTKIDFNQMAKRRLQDFVDRYSEARGNYTTDFKYKFSEGRMTEDEIERSYQNGIENAEIAFDRIEEAYNRLDSFGYSKDEKIDLMKSAGVRSADIFRITKGMDFEPFKKGVPESIQDQYDRIIEGKTRAEKVNEIKKLYAGDAEDRIKAERFRAEMKRRQTNEKYGRSAQDLLLMNLNASDRADLLVEMNAHIDRSLYLEMRRKRIITKDVERLLRSR